ncbi:MAG: response regulator [Acetobacteraceae bacterium]
MGRLNRRPWSFPVLASLVVLIMVTVLGTGAVMVSHVTATLDTLRGTTASADVVTGSAQNLLLALQEAEVGQSGYLLTGRPDYLSPYWAAAARMRTELAKLDAVAEQEEWLRPVVQSLRALGERKFAELERAIAAADTSGIAAARASMLTSDSQATMHSARVLIDWIETRAAEDRDRRGAEAQGRERLLFVIILVTAVVGMLLLGTASLALLAGRDRLLHAQAAVRDQAARWQATVENLHDGVAVFDAEDRLVLCNAKLLPITGFPPALAQPGTPFSRFVAEAAQWVPPTLAAGPVGAEGVTVEVHAAGRVLEVSRNAMPGGGHMLAVGDATHRVQMETVGRQSQKMEVLGQLTGGVAHDFNNLLQVVSANLELVADEIPDDSGLRARLAGAMEGVQRGARLTRHLLAFARRQPLAPTPLDARQRLSGLDDMLRRTLGPSIDLKMVIAEGLWALRADAQQLENALLNLAINARDAMADRPGQARLTIEAYNAELDAGYAARNADVTPGQYVVIAVSDTGRGMTREQIARAVEPFYTTKPEGQGTGLGLSMVYGFAKQSGGHLKLYSEVGHGTTARLYIPRTALLPQPTDATIADTPRGKGETVLLVEDEPTVRASAGLALRSLGYKVEEAVDADAAMRMIEQGLRPDLLFTDLMMPGALSARAMAERAQARVSGLAVVFTTGYAENAVAHGGRLDDRVHLVSKPWRTSDLARRLRTALEQARASVAAAPKQLRILLVEDEILVRTITADMLTGMGHGVIEAGNADEALRRLAGVDLLITDVGLGHTDGLTLATSARAILPRLPVIIVSGQAMPPKSGEAFVYLPKPYDDRTLRDAVVKAMRSAV